MGGGGIPMIVYYFKARLGCYIFGSTTGLVHRGINFYLKRIFIKYVYKLFRDKKDFYKLSCNKMSLKNKIHTKQCKQLKTHGLNRNLEWIPNLRC